MGRYSRTRGTVYQAHQHICFCLSEDTQFLLPTNFGAFISEMISPKEPLLFFAVILYWTSSRVMECVLLSAKSHFEKWGFHVRS
jgi:hypothetical protein